MITGILLLLAAPACAGITPPDAATLSAGAVARRTIEIVWTAPGDDGSSGTAASYELRYTPIGPIDTAAKFTAAAAAGPLPAPSPAGTSEAFTITGLNPDTTYYIALRTFDEVPNSSNLSPSLQLKTLSLSTPAAVGGIRGLRAPGTGDFTISWSPVAKYLDGSPVDQDFNYYSVWKATALLGPYTPAAKLSTGTFFYTDSGSLAAPAVYRVTAGDLLGSTGPHHTLLANDAESTLIFHSPDGSVRLEVPTASQPQFFASGPFGADLFVRWTRRSGEEAGTVLLSYDLAAVRSDDGSEAAVAFPTPGAGLVFSAPAGTPLSRIAIFGFNGVDFTKLGGRSASGSDMSLAITQPGTYRLQEAIRAASFQVTTLVPRKIFTPNGDGINDAISIHFENPGAEAISGDIFDLSGARIAALTRGAVADSLQWDGRDESGRIARTGIYIYQIKGAGARANGTLVLIR